MYIEHIKYYSDHSRWLAKLFLQFCREYKCQFLMFESSWMDRRGRFDWLVKYPQVISGTVLYFESELDLCEFACKECCTPAFYRHFMWKYFLVTHQNNIPSYFKSYIGAEQLVSELKKCGTRNDKRLENIFKTLSIDNG